MRLLAGWEVPCEAFGREAAGVPLFPWVIPLQEEKVAHFKVINKRLNEKEVADIHKISGFP